jgi:small subunit ribosomal protein S6
MRSYELMIIHRPELAETDVRRHVADVENAITDGGEVSGTDFWGKRRFAYEIDHIHEGFYSVVDFRADTELINRLDRALSLLDTVVRHKIVRRPDRD